MTSSISLAPAAKPSIYTPNVVDTSIQVIDDEENPVQLTITPVETRDSDHSPHKIGQIWSRLKSELERSQPRQERIGASLEKLGVDKSDQEARRALLPIVKLALHPDVEIISASHEDDSGVYFLTLHGEKFAVFKIGEKRAQMEILARRAAHLFGLQHAIPGIFCAIQNPSFANGRTIVELYNGNQKIYNNYNGKYAQQTQDDNFGLDHPPTIAGILEPFIDTNAGMTHSEYTNMVAYAVCIGLRDGKLDGTAGAIIFDAEECFPPKIDPVSSPNRRVAAINLPMLEHPFAKQAIDQDTLQQLAKKINEIDLGTIDKLRDQVILFPDFTCESIRLDDSELPQRAPSSSDDELWDHGGCYVKIEKTHQITDNNQLIHIDSQDRRPLPLLTNSQLTATFQRISRLQDCLNSCIRDNYLPTPLDLVLAVDPLYRAQYKALQRANSRHHSPHVLGRFSPHDCRVVIDDEELTRGWAPPSPSPSTLSRSFSIDLSSSSGSLPPLPSPPALVRPSFKPRKLFASDAQSPREDHKDDVKEG